MKGFFKFGSPMIEIIFEDNNIMALLDTGFTGEIMLPENLISELNLKQIGISEYIGASGEIKQTKVFKAEIQFFGKTMEIDVLSTEANFSLAGMELFHNCKILIEMNKDIVEITESKSRTSP